MRTVTSDSFSNSSDYSRRESRSPSPVEEAQKKVIEELGQKFSAQSQQPENESSNNDAIISEITGIIRDNSQEKAVTIILAIIQKMKSVENLEFFYQKTMGVIVNNLTRFNEAQQIQAIKTAYEERKKSLSEKPTQQSANNPSRPKENKILLDKPEQQFRSRSQSHSQSDSRKSWIQSLRSPRSVVNDRRRSERSGSVTGNQLGFFNNSAPIVDTIYLPQDPKDPKDPRKHRQSQGCPKIICSVM